LWRTISQIYMWKRKDRKKNSLSYVNFSSIFLLTFSSFCFAFLFSFFFNIVQRSLTLLREIKRKNIYVYIHKNVSNFPIKDNFFFLLFILLLFLNCHTVRGQENASEWESELTISPLFILLFDGGFFKCGWDGNKKFYKDFSLSLSLPLTYSLDFFFLSQ
jgi:hypothetical protein